MSVKNRLLKLYSLFFWEPINSKVTATAGDHEPAEIEYRNRRGELVGFWAYGYWDPKGPYKGQFKCN